MSTLRFLRALGPIDLHSVRRDSLLRWMLLYPLLIAAFLRWAVPPLAARAQAVFGVDLTAYYDLLVSLVVMANPLMLGVVVGFLLLDQRDDRTLQALQVTPLTLNGYLAYRVALPTLLSLAAALVMVPFSGLVRLAPLDLLLVAAASAPLAPAVALALAALASNKVQGFALAKGMGVLFLPPLVAYFVPPGWQLAFGVVPTFWPVRLYWALQASEPLAWAYLAAGFAYQAALLWVLARRFNAVMTR